MGLSIGQLNLQLVGDAKGLKKLLPDMNRLGAAIDKLSKSQVTGSARSVSALNRQEQAIRRQLSAVQNLNAQIKRSGGPSNLVGSNTVAMKAFTKAMSKGVLTTTQFNRVNDRLSGTLSRSGRTLRKFQSSVKADKVTKMGQAMRNLESASVLAVGPLSGIGARIRAIGAIAGRTALLLAALFAGITLGIVGLVKLGIGAVNAAKSMEQVIARLTVATGSAGQAGANFKFVSDSAKSMGLNVRKSADSFSQLAAATRGTAAAGKITRKVFEGISAAGAALRLTADQIDGAFRAVQQIASKGRVQSEELIGQLAERIPNAIQIAAEAFGVQQSALLEMVQNGLVPATEFLDKFGRQLLKVFGPDAAKNIDSIQAAINRLDNATFEFSLKLDKLLGVSTLWSNILDTISGGIESLTRNMNTLFNVIGGVVGAMLALAAPSIIAGVIVLSKAIRGMAVAMAAFKFATLASKGPLKALTKIAIAALGAAVGFAVMKALLSEVDFLFDELEDSADNANKGLNKLQREGLSAILDDVQDLKIDLAVLQGGLGDTSEAAIRAAAGMGQFAKFLGDGIVEIKPLPDVLEDAIAKLDTFTKAVANLEFAKAAFNDTRTAAEKFAISLAKIESARATIKIVFIDQPEVMAKFLDSLDRAELKLNKLTGVSKELGTAFTQGFEDAIFAGKSLGEVLKSLLVDLLKIIIRAAILKPLGNAIGGALGSVLGFAKGGRTPSNESFIVGEDGPEVLSFGKSGTVTPNDALGRVGGNGSGGNGGTVSIVQHITFTTTIKDDVRAIIVESLPAIASATIGALTDETQRNGIIETFG